MNNYYIPRYLNHDETLYISALWAHCRGVVFTPARPRRVGKKGQAKNVPPGFSSPRAGTDFSRPRKHSAGPWTRFVNSGTNFGEPVTDSETTGADFAEPRTDQGEPGVDPGNPGMNSSFTWMDSSDYWKDSSDYMKDSPA